MSSYLCGLDIGGTFTDCVLIDDDGRLTIAKAPSTPGNFAAGVMEAIARAAAKIGRDVNALLEDIHVLAHGTTVGTNTIIQRRGAKLALVVSRGNRDVFEIVEIRLGRPPFDGAVGPQRAAHGQPVGGVGWRYRANADGSAQRPGVGRKFRLHRRATATVEHSASEEFTRRPDVGCPSMTRTPRQSGLPRRVGPSQRRSKSKW